jgi:hypothetical protein
MSKQFPPVLQNIMRQPEVKAAWMSDNEPRIPSDCNNCGGLGFFAIFVASNGPYNYPPQKGVGHYDGEHWWQGVTYTDVCPVCKGLR